MTLLCVHRLDIFVRVMICEKVIRYIRTQIGLKGVNEDI